MLVKRLYIIHHRNLQKEKLEEDNIKPRMENEKYNRVRNDLFGKYKLRRGSAIVSSIRGSELESQSKRSTAQIILGFIIWNWDMIIVTALYFAGSYQIDIYHI